MATLKKLDMAGNEVGFHEIEDALLEVTAHPQMIKDYIVAIRNNGRQWSASTKGRIEVNKTGKKPHPQKGQGRSRQGCLAAPQYKGGGIVFGPRPKFDQHVKINRKERRMAIRFLLAERIQGQNVYILQGEMKEPKTAQIASLLAKHGLDQRRVLLLGTAPVDAMRDASQDKVQLSVRNLPKKEFRLVSNINGYDLALSHGIVVLEQALPEFLAILGGNA